MKGSITVYKGRNNNYRQVLSSSNWFSGSEYYTFIEKGDCFTIKKHYMEIPKTAQWSNRGYFHFLSNFPIGKFEFEEDESSEDVAVIYCNK